MGGTLGATISYRLIYIQRILTKDLIMKPIGEKILEAIIITIVITGTAMMAYGFYQVIDVMFIRNHSTC